MKDPHLSYLVLASLPPNGESNMIYTTGLDGQIMSNPHISIDFMVNPPRKLHVPTFKLHSSSMGSHEIGP